MIGLLQVCNSSKSHLGYRFDKGKMIEDLKDVGKTPDEKHRFTIHIIIS